MDEGGTSDPRPFHGYVYKPSSRLCRPSLSLFPPFISTMASLLSTATQAAHSAAVSLMTAAEVKPGSTIPTKVPVKEEEAAKTFTLEGIKGINVFVRYPISDMYTGMVKIE